MPQTTRKDGAITQRIQDKESKRARGALSCAECRRLKLKCDKTVPCSSCKRRGCSAICPNGSLITGQGTRFVLADTEKLHQKIAQMSDRIRQLEDALAILQSTQTRETHPLLHRDLLKIKSSIELHAAVEGEEGVPQEEMIEEESQYIDAFGTLAIRDDGAATFYGRSAGSESLLIGEASSPQPDRTHQRSNLNTGWNTELPTTINNLANAFPLGSNVQLVGITLDQIVRSFLPSWHEAWRLCELYLEQAPWFFGAVTKRQLHEEMLPLWYNEAPKPLASSASPPETTVNPVNHGPPIKGGAHELALLFVIFCFGALTDMALPPAPDNQEAEQYYQLTKAALTLEPVLERPPSVATVQTLSLMAIYEGLCSGENSIESTWALMGIATKLSQSIGLHRDCARWNLTPAEVQKRRALFWELFITDCWQSLATGRLATFSLPFVDCELPFDPDQTMTDDGTVQPSFPYWKARFGAECVSAIVQGTLTSRAPKYSVILELDRKVRDMELPLFAQGPPPQGVGLAQTMSHFMPINYRELTLLYVHRCFFAHAISTHPQDPIKSQYAPSFLAGYRSACTILVSLRQQFSMFPAQIARFWVLWTHAFSAAVMLASVVTHSSQSKVAPAALLELRTACELFEKASSYGGRAGKFLPIIQRLQMKAQQVYLDTNSGIPPSVPGDIFKLTKPAEKDELSIFSGQTHTVSTKMNTPPSHPHPSPSVNGGTSSSRASSDSPHQPYTDNPSFAGVHPSLVNELNAFDGHINAQIQNAYHVNDGAFAQPMDNSRERRHQQQQMERQTYEAQQRSDQENAQRKDMARQQLEQQQSERMELERQQQVRQQQQQQQDMQNQQRLQEQQLFEQHQQQQRELQRQQVELASQPQPQTTHHHQTQNTMQYQPYSQQQQQQSSTFSNSFSHGILGAEPTQAHVPRHQLSHSQSHSSLQEAYQQYQHRQQPRQARSQHQMYVVPPEYQHQHVSSEAATPSSATTSHFSQAESYHDPNTHAQRNESQYWPATGYTNPSQFAQGQTHEYTPYAALKGIAAEDRGLQETWQTYMSKVGSPRHLFED
ncbi:fungal-specific transcription factor domain-containing protein [Collybia nuda]|uniref:Fungal-specific transcription factor domain-containing protein n=1 Tax=Collybia nuda TaxID=64659 RepID=A0A9P5Y4A2_9AGAR|nr:fungal-specific transcription factor domain-containing protein [Collybia nuda]